MDNARAYLKWLKDFVRDKHHESSVISDAHLEITRIVNDAMLSLDEIIVLFAGVSSTFCKDATDINVAVNLFDETLYGNSAVMDHEEAEIADEDDEELRW